MRRPGDNRARTRQLTSQACGETNSDTLYRPALTRPSTRRTARTSAVALSIAAAVFGGTVAAGAPAQAAVPAQAATASPGHKVVAEAKSHQGKPYVYGAVGPNSFDCSGFTKYVFSRFGKNLPRTAAAQYTATQHLAKGAKQAGDLIFMRSSSGTITHVGIYAGAESWWVAPKAGDRVKLQKLYSPNYLVGRVA
jgi:cell wall-associated NlpC family hydrolase